MNTARTRTPRATASQKDAAAKLFHRGYDAWKAQPTIDSGHFDNLKYDDGEHRVWVSRSSPADWDGDVLAWMRGRLTVERFVGGNWKRVLPTSLEVETE